MIATTFNPEILELAIKLEYKHINHGCNYMFFYDNLIYSVTYDGGLFVMSNEYFVKKLKQDYNKRFKSMHLEWNIL